MKIVRFLYQREESYGRLRDGVINPVNGEIFGNYELTDREISLDKVELLNPVQPPNIFAIGLNYKKHAIESGHNRFPPRPVIFIKATSSVIGPDDDIILPHMAPDEVDYEAELAIVIGKRAKNVEPEDTDDYVLGYTCANDVSARDCQQRLDKQWARAKSFDTFCPLGPWIETDIEDPENCDISSRLNGKVMQDSNTSDLIFDTSELISYCSNNFTLLPGTVIMTGTPEGVGFARKSPVFLSPGDEIEIEIEGIGTLKNSVSLDNA